MQSTDPVTGASAPAPGWYPDPWQVAPTRWWDGLAWTGFTTAPPPPVAAPLASPGAPADWARHRSFELTTAPARGPALPTARDDIEGGGTAVLGFFGAIALSLLFEQVASAMGARPLTVPNLVLGTFGLWVGLWMTAYIVSHRRPGGTLADLGLRVPTRSEVGLGIAIGFTGLVIAAQVSAGLRALFPDTGGGSHLFVTSTPSLALVYTYGLLACVGAPIIEELFFRGIVQPVMMRNLGIPQGILASAMLFGGAHYDLGMTFNQAAVKCGTILVLGLFLGWLRVRTGRLGAGMVAHATNNIIVIAGLLIALTHVS